MKDCSFKRAYYSNVQISLCLSNLMLTGSAVPYLHNGIMSADENDATNFEVNITLDVTTFE